MFLSLFSYGLYCFLLFYKVEGYYEIIEEPMDFGTMRAKLHEGMYKNLEQFEVTFLKNYFCFKCSLLFHHKAEKVQIRS